MSATTAPRPKSTTRPAYANLRLRKLGRWAIWMFLAVMLIKGVVSTVNPPQSKVIYINRGGTAQWAPTPQALATAQDFAREYLTINPEGSQEHLAAWYASGAEVSVPTSGSRGGASVLWTEPAVWAKQDAGHETITVEAMVHAAGQTIRRYLAVPIAETKEGIAVYGAPAFVAGPPIDKSAKPASLERTEQETTASKEVEELLKKFISAYLKGGDLTYFTVPNSTVASPSGAGMELQSLDSAKVLSAQGALEQLLVRVTAEDKATGAAFPFQYLVTLKRVDRWYVQAIQR